MRRFFILEGFLSLFLAIILSACNLGGGGGSGGEGGGGGGEDGGGEPVAGNALEFSQYSPAQSKTEDVAKLVYAMKSSTKILVKKLKIEGNGVEYNHRLSSCREGGLLDPGGADLVECVIVLDVKYAKGQGSEQKISAHLTITYDEAGALKKEEVDLEGKVFWVSQDQFEAFKLIIKNDNESEDIGDNNIIRQFEIQNENEYSVTFPKYPKLIINKTGQGDNQPAEYYATNSTCQPDKALTPRATCIMWVKMNKNLKELDTNLHYSLLGDNKHQSFKFSFE